MRFGGLFSRYYHWREGVGPVAAASAMRNYVWGGVETNRVGTREFVDLCRRIGAEPLYCVNFLSDGEKRYRTMPEGNRTGDAREAADWVSYANDPDHRERRQHGSPDPFRIQLWQLGNETSYGNATFTRDESIAHTLEFAKAMKQRDPSIRLIGWGDRGRGGDSGRRTCSSAPASTSTCVAIHMMGQSPKRPDTVLKGTALPEGSRARLGRAARTIARNVEQRVTELEAIHRRVRQANRHRDHRRPPQPQSAQRQSHPLRMALRRLSCALAEHLPAARRARQDRHRRGFPGQSLDQQRGHAADATRRHAT